MASISLAFDVNVCFLAESTVVSSLPRSNIGTTYDSSTDMQTLSKLVGRVTSLAKTSVAALNDLYVSKAVFLPFPANDETVSQPVKAWNMGRACAFSAPKEVAIS